MMARAMQFILHDKFMPGTDLKLGGARAVALRLVHELHETNLGGVVTEEQILAKFCANIDALKEAGRNAEAPEWVRFLLRFARKGGNWYRPAGSEVSTENRGHQRRLPMSSEEKLPQTETARAFSQMDYRPNRELLAVLLEAYRPCKNFGVCREAQWNPEGGQIPRGFLGATGELSEVELVMVFSEPGHPYADDGYDPDLDALGLMDGGLRQTYECFKTGTDLFHRNARWFMAQLYPDLSFDEQLRHVWLTEGRLCSIDVEIGATTDRTCAAHYLTRQLDFLPNATAVAFGGKAKRYLRGLDIARLEAYALAPPGANHKPAKPSWERAIAEIEARRS